MNSDTAIAVVLSVFILGMFGGIAVSSFAPDATAQRIAACMQQPNMQYNNFDGCIPIESGE